MKVLVAYDGSSTSRYALEHSLPMLQAQQAELLLLTVVPEMELMVLPPGGEMHPPWSTGAAQDLEQQLQETGPRILEEAAQMVETVGLRYKTQAMFGSPRLSICHVAESEKIDLIVMGSRGLGPVKRLLLGSVSDYVVHHAHCSVFISRPSAE